MGDQTEYISDDFSEAFYKECICHEMLLLIFYNNLIFVFSNKMHRPKSSSWLRCILNFGLSKT